jgi:hypothetical protein
MVTSTKFLLLQQEILVEILDKIIQILDKEGALCVWTRLKDKVDDDALLATITIAAAAHSCIELNIESALDCVWTT